MRWKGRRASDNVEDRRSVSGKAVVGGGIGVVVLALAIMFLGGDPSQVLQGVQQGGTQQGAEYKPTAEEDELAQFLSVVLAETETTWVELFRVMGRQYEAPKLVLYTAAVDTACGHATAAVGPFYCPGDRKVYIDLSFCKELRDRFKAPGDFALAYVLAHEVGHHIQTLLGINDQVNEARRRLSEREYNEVSVRMELQADYMSGVWAHYAKRMNILEAGDLEEALGAASAVGDDRIQESMTGSVRPDTFTHGTSAQRKSWFFKGFQTGDLSKGDTFAAATL